MTGIKMKNYGDKADEKKLGEKFAKGLLAWNRKSNQRQMPWKGEKDPYKIWISEIILQQTKVEQGLKYYEAFIKNFPAVHHLAKAPDQKVFKLWEGLGYYSRCKNLLASARFIAEELNGVFPSDYESILNLKGVGNYTAAAIASFAYNLPYAVLDGNVFRVLSRIFDVELPIDSKEGKQRFSALAQQILPKKAAGEYNQAIMDFGATICKPAPVCAECFFNKNCRAYLQGKQQSLPIKAKELKIRERWFNYIILIFQNQYAVRERTSKDIWQHLFEFPLIETTNRAAEEEIKKMMLRQFGLKGNDYKTLLNKQGTAQKLSHQKIHFQYTIIEMKKEIVPDGFVYVSQKQLRKYPFPKTLKQFIKDELGI
jgi:A/G-specific adenine glycosylase